MIRGEPAPTSAAATLTPPGIDDAFQYLLVRCLVSAPPAAPPAAAAAAALHLRLRLRLLPVRAGLRLLSASSPT